MGGDGAYYCSDCCLWSIMVFIPSAESKRNEWLTRCENPVNESKKNSERAIVRNFFAHEVAKCGGMCAGWCSRNACKRAPSVFSNRERNLQRSLVLRNFLVFFAELRHTLLTFREKYDMIISSKLYYFGRFLCITSELIWAAPTSPWAS